MALREPLLSASEAHTSTSEWADDADTEGYDSIASAEEQEERRERERNEKAIEQLLLDDTSALRLRRRVLPATSRLRSLTAPMHTLEDTLLHTSASIGKEEAEKKKNSLRPPSSSFSLSSAALSADRPPPFKPHTDAYDGTADDGSEGALVELRRREQRRWGVRWRLALTPLVLFASMALFLATGPGTQGTAAALLFRNSFLRLVAGLGQVMACVWAFAFVLALLRNAPRLRLEDVLPQRTLQADAKLTKLAFQASVVYCVGVVVYVGLNWRPQDNNKDHYHAAIPPAVVQLLFFLVVLAALVLPGLAAWQQRRAFLILLLQCVSCIVGYSPLARIDFEHVLLTDILTSTSTALYDLVFAGCHFADQNFREHSVWQDSKVTRAGSRGV